MDTASPLKARKKRIPKACGSCRHSKVKCDGKSPCSRCSSLQKTCVFEKPQKDDQDMRIEALESELKSLRAMLPPQLATEGGPSLSAAGDAPMVSPSLDGLGTSELVVASAPVDWSSTAMATTNIPPTTSPGFEQPSPFGSLPSLSTSRKRKRTHFEVETLPTSDFVSTGLISPDDARLYFDTFFKGCHQYVPVFDPKSDSMEAIQGRSDVLFSTICATGCRILKGSDSQPWRLMNFHIKHVLNAAIATPLTAKLETIQALLVRACYVSERSLLITLATRMAADLGLPEAYDEMCARCIQRPGDHRAQGTTDPAQAPNQCLEPWDPQEMDLMRKTRTWLQLLNLGHILHVDASDLLIFKFRGDVRRCRVLLQSPLSSVLDLHLISQVELNVHRSSIYAALPISGGLTDEETMDAVHDAKIDIEVWYSDWMRIFERSVVDQRWLAQNLRIQQCWADIMTMCRAVRISGVENVNAMSSTQRDILLMAKTALEQHLGIILEEPRDYLRNLRFAMDFVWAKCAFCFLLLLKLSTLLGQDQEDARQKLIIQGETLISELRHAEGNGNGGRTSTSRVYLQLLQAGIDKFSRTPADGNVTPLGRTTGTNTPRRQRESAEGTETDSFIPEQFVFEWDFPGLTLFSSPTTDSGWFDEFLRSALMSGEDFYNYGWNSVDMPM